MSEATIVSPVKEHGRDRYIDTLRAVALIRVVTYHSFTLIWLPVVFPSMGIMFALAGALVASSLDRQSAGEMLRRRLHRLLPPVWVFGLILLPLMVWHGWTFTQDGASSVPLTWGNILFWILPISDPPSSVWGFDYIEPLWYIRAYLWFLLASPALLWAWKRYGLGTLLVPLVGLVATQVGWLSVGDGRSGAVIIDASVFGACWLLGFAHHYGQLRTFSLRWLLPVSVTVMALGLNWALHHQQGAPDLWDISNIPLADGLWCLGAVLLLLRFYPSFAWLAKYPWLDWLISAINQRAMTIYLWNNVAVALAYLAIVNQDWADGWKSAIVVAALTWMMLGLIVVVIGPVEDLAARRKPQWIPGRRKSSLQRNEVPAFAQMELQFDR